LKKSLKTIVELRAFIAYNLLFGAIIAYNMQFIKGAKSSVYSRVLPSELNVRV
jgi:hypothetical protein